MLLLSLVCALSWSTFQLRQQEEREREGREGGRGDGNEPARPSTVDPGALMLYKVVVATRERERRGSSRWRRRGRSASKEPGRVSRGGRGRRRMEAVTEKLEQIFTTYGETLTPTVWPCGRQGQAHATWLATCRCRSRFGNFS